MEQINLDNWAKLYEHSIKLKDIRPWEQFSFLDTITIKLPEREEMYYVSIDDHFGMITVSILRDIVSYTKFIDINLNTEMSETELFNQLCSIDIFSINISGRDSVSKEQLNIIKELKLTFRGKTDWISFSTKRKGYAPTTPNEQEVIFMTQCAEQICHATNDYLKKKMDINFDDGYSLCRYFDDDEKKWTTLEKKVKLEREKIEFYNYTNEIQLQKLKKLPVLGIDIELDITFLMSRLEASNGKDIIARVLLIADKNNAEIIVSQIILPTDDIVEETFSILFQVMEQFGKIREIYYQRDLCEGILYDFCAKTGIEISRKAKLDTIKNFIEMQLQENN